MSPGDISSLSQSDAVAFRVDFESTVPPQRDLYWRGLILHRFDGRAWTGDKEPSIAASAQKRVEVLGNPVKYQVTLEPTRQHWVFALDIPYLWTLERTFMGPQQQLARLQSIDQRIEYEAVSYTRFRVDAEFDERRLNRYRNLPAGRNPRSAELARRMHADAPTDEAFINDACSIGTISITPSSRRHSAATRSIASCSTHAVDSASTTRRRSLS